MGRLIVRQPRPQRNYHRRTRQRPSRPAGAPWPVAWLVLLMIALAAIGLTHESGAPTITAPSLTGHPARITDGDTLRMGDIRVRLQGIDAPEMSTPEGHLARQHLIGLIGSATIACEDTGQRSYDRVVAVCRTVSGRDLARAMVEDGWAVDWPRFSGGRYALAQVRAQVAGRGIHVR